MLIREPLNRVRPFRKERQERLDASAIVPPSNHIASFPSRQTVDQLEPRPSTRRICLYLDPSRVFRWHTWLYERLVATPGYEVTIKLAAERRPLPRSCVLVFELERLIYGASECNSMVPSSALFRAAADDAIESSTPFDTVVIARAWGSPCRHAIASSLPVSMPSRTRSARSPA